MVAGGMLHTFDDDDDFDVRQQEQNRSGKQGANETALAQTTRRKLSTSSHVPQTPPIVYMMSVLSALGGFLFGYDTGIVSGAMVFVKKFFHLNSLWQEIVVSITVLGAWMFSLAAGSLSERYGRKTMILFASIIFTLGSVIMGFAWSKYVLLVGRLTVGIAIGLASTIVPVYIAEVAPPSIRGSLVSINNCFITFGQLVAAITAGAFSYDHENGWRWMLAIAAVPAIIQFMGFVFMPESPRWLIRRNRDDEALAALKRIRGDKNPYVLREFDKIRQNQMELSIQETRRKEQKRNIFVAIFRKTATRRALMVGCLIQAVQQLAGINTVMYYTATIIEMSGVQSQSIAVWLAVPTAAVYVIFGFCGYLVADRVNRRTLTLGSLMGVIIALLVLATGFHLTSMNGAPVTFHNMSTLTVCYTKPDCTSCIAEPRCGFCYDAKNMAVTSCLEKSHDDSTRSVGGDCDASRIGASNSFVFANHVCPPVTQGIGLNTWLVLTGLVLYLAAFAPGMSPMPWTINSEIYPQWARSFCYSIATSVNWMFNLLISLTFISLTELITTHGAFYMYAIISCIGWLLLFWKLPETRGRTLEEVSQMFAKQKPDDQDIIDEDMSGGNQSSHGGTGHTHNGVVAFSEGVAPMTIDGSKRPSILCHDNLGYTGEHGQYKQATHGQSQHHNYHQHHNQSQGTVKNPPSVDHSESLERQPSLKMTNPLSKAAKMAISQPNLQSHTTQQHQVQQPIYHLQQQSNIASPTLNYGQKQPHQPKRKYYDGGQS